MTEGVVRVSSAARQHSAASTASAGRKTLRLGIARQRGEVLHRLMSRAVLAHADGVVGAHVDHRTPISAASLIAGRCSR